MFRAITSHSSAQVAMSAANNALRRSGSGSVSPKIVGPLAKFQCAGVEVGGTRGPERDIVAVVHNGRARGQSDGLAI